ncbi:TonB-dependent receptor family protein [Pseudaquabacterium rugosum]|uniref:TonB-dependent receptor n=1 Tax=Pseudaquabacterium rugosum TaxID=2984194 RepID=A0ABU9B9T7_9BURK
MPCFRLHPLARAGLVLCRWLPAVCVLGPAAARAAQADAVPPDAPAAVERVVVTGATRAARTLDLPFAVSTIDAAALRAGGPMLDLSEATALVPGLTVNQRHNYAQDLQISSRGFGARTPFGVRGLRLYADGIPATMPDGQGQVAHFDLAGAQRIEVLRGPFSVLYGNSSGGVIALFGASPRERRTEFALDAGSFGLRQGRFAVALPSVDGSPDLRASLTHATLDGYRPQSAADRTLAQLRSSWQDRDDRVVVSLSAQRQQAQDPLGLMATDFAIDPRSTISTATTYDTRKSIEQTQWGVNWQHRFGEGGALQDSAVTVYQGWRSVTQFQGLLPTFQGTTSSGGVIDFDRTYAGLDGRLNWRFGTVDLVTGAAYERQTDDRQGYQNFLGTAVAPTARGVVGALRRDETNRARSQDVYAQATWPLATDWTLTAGVRSGEVTLSTSDRYITSDNGDDSDRMALSYTNPVVGLAWKVTPRWSVHLSAARGFESPTLGELAYGSTSGVGGFNRDLKGQSSRQVELGTKWSDARSSAEVAIFEADTRNEIAVDASSGGRTTYHNVGDTRRRGLEIGASARLAPGLSVQSALTWLQAEYQQSYSTSAGTVAAGNRIAGTRRGQLAADLAWRPAPGLGEWALEWRAYAALMANDVNDAHAPGYALVNLRWRGEVALGAEDALELLARVDNAAGRVHVASVIVNDGNRRYFEPGAPRSLLVSARWQHRW